MIVHPLLLVLFGSSDSQPVTQCVAIAGYRARGPESFPHIDEPFESSGSLICERKEKERKGLRKSTKFRQERRVSDESLTLPTIRSIARISTGCKEWRGQGRTKASREDLAKKSGDIYFFPRSPRETVRRRDVNVTPQLVREHA